MQKNIVKYLYTVDLESRKKLKKHQPILLWFTGLSGSGKSSLAFDTLYAEGQRRYVESLSSYARQFLGRLDKPKVDKIEGLAPAIAIEQRVNSTNPRSTVGTTTEIYDYLKLLYARIGTTYSPISNEVVTKDSVSNILDQIKSYKEETKLIEELNNILGWVDELKKVDTEQIEPMLSVFNESMIMRKDEVCSETSDDLVLKNAPESKSGFFVVPKVVE